MSVREENLRLRIEAVSDLPDLSSQYTELIRLTKQHADVMVQSAQLIKAQIAEEGAAVRAQTDEYRKQDAAQRAASAAAKTAATEAKNAAKEVAEELKRQTAAQQALTDAERATAVAARAAAIAQRSDIKGVSDQMDEAGKSVRNFQTMLLAAFTLSEIKSFGQDVIDAKTRIDSLQIALTTMLGSRREADELYAKVVNLAKSTPFSLAEVGDQVAKLKAYNIATEDLIPTITALGNMAAAVGKEKLPQITLAYGQIANTGKLMGTELKQLTEAGIPVFDLLASSMGKTKKEIIDLQTVNAITFADIRKAFMDASEAGGKYAGLMANVSKTVGGQISNLGDAYDVAKARIGNFFEDQIKGGTRLMGELIETLLGSESAIKRTSLAVASAVTVFATFRVATTAQALATAAMSGAQGAATLITGTYNLVMLTLKGTTEGLTRAQLESAVAARSSFAVIAANPVGAFVTVVGLAVAAVLAWKAAQDDISVTMGQQEFDLRKGQDEINRMVTAATSLKETDVRRKEAIQELIAKYPEYFSGLNTEKTTNAQLRGVLDEVNKSYTSRIALAKEAYTVEKLNENRRKLWDEEEASIARLVKRVPELKQFGNDAVGVLNYLSKNAEADFKARNATDGKTWLDYIANGNSVVTLEKLKKNLDNVETELKASDARVLTATIKNKEVDIANTHAHYARLIKDAAGNKTEIARLKQEEHDTVDKLNGTYRKKELVDTGDHAEKIKKVTLLSANEIKLIKQGNNEGEQLDRMKQLKDQLAYLETLEKAEIDSATKITVNKKISNAQLAALKEKSRQEVAAIDAKYDLKRAEILIQIEEQNQKDFLLKVKETQEKVEVLTVKRLEAERILTALNTAQTEEQRLAVMKEYNKKINVSIEEQATAQLKIQVDKSKAALDDIKAKNGERGDEYRKAYEAWLNDDKQYQSALTTQSIAATKSRAAAIIAIEKEIQDTKEETAKINAETLKIYEQSGKQMLNMGLDLLSQQSGLIGQLGKGIKTAYDNLDSLSGKASEAAGQRLVDAQNALVGIQMIYSDGTREGALEIEKAEQQVAKSQKGVAEATAASSAATMSLISIGLTIAIELAKAISEMMAGTYRTIADTIGAMRTAYSDLYEMVAKNAKEAFDAELEAMQGSYAEREALIVSFYDKQKGLVANRDRIDIELGYNQEMMQAMAEFHEFGTLIWNRVGNLRKAEAEARKNQQIAEQEAIVRQIEFELQKAEELKNAKIQFIDEALSKYKETISAEIDLAEEAADVRIDAVNRQLDAVKIAYDAEVTKVKEAYDAQLSALKDKESQARTEIQATYDLKQTLLTQSTNDEIEKVGIIDRVRNEVLERYRTTEVDKLIATRDRILATLTDEGERARVTNEFATQIGQVHKDVEDGKLDKTKGVSLATTQLRTEEKDKSVALKGEEKTAIETMQDAYQVTFKALADERNTTLKDMKDAQVLREGVLKEQITTIQNELKTQITNLQNQITQQEIKANGDKKRANEDYANAVMKANKDIFEANRRMKLAELDAEIAILRSKRNFLNRGKIDSAIGDLESAKSEITGISFDGGTVSLGGAISGAVGALFTALGIATVPTDVNTSQPVTVAFDKKGNPMQLTYNPSGKVIDYYDASGARQQVAYADGYVPATGERFFKGTPYLELGGNPGGVDTIPVLANEGERILPTADNLAIGGRSLTNDQLVDKVSFYDKFAMQFPQLLNPAGWAVNSVMTIPANIMADQGGGVNAMELREMISEMQGLRTDILNKKYVEIKMDKSGFGTYLIGRQSRTQEISNLFNR